MLEEYDLFVFMESDLIFDIFINFFEVVDDVFLRSFLGDIVYENDEFGE